MRQWALWATLCWCHDFMKLNKSNLMGGNEDSEGSVEHELRTQIRVDQQKKKKSTDMHQEL